MNNAGQNPIFKSQTALVMSELFTMDSYYIQTKFLRIFGGAFWFKDSNDQLIAYSKQKRFKLKEDIVLYTDESCTQPLLAIKARSIIDFGATYDIVDAVTGENLGAARRKGLKSIFKDTWKILDANGNEYAELVEDSVAILRRFVPFIPAKYHFSVQGQHDIMMYQRFNPIIKKTDILIPEGHPLDRRVIAAVALLNSVIEGRQG
ncbi:MAG: hypothetical protein CXX81_02510 [Methanobacteriota archaeon]|nr:MAG: hypothetical protein CXX81_23845 [Euryarchaeota archaeon]PXY75743.1 MAG: hypothetical protein CXX81_17315 [Euryarchaeota archaeon]PXY79429.1 MAG: hypothetical protein CXX81_02510 [Euryarchaeota archaeon]